MTYSIGFKAPVQSELTAELLHKLAEFGEDRDADVSSVGPRKMYRDPGQAATPHPAELPAALITFASDAVRHALHDPLALACALGEVMTTPKAQVWFEQAGADWDGSASGQSLMLDVKTRMMYDADHVFINGESYRAKGRDARLMHLLADQRALPASAWAKASNGALALLGDWYAEGWLHLAVEQSGDNKQLKH